MDVEAVLSRADVVQYVYFSQKYNEVVREILSRGNQPLTKNEAICIRNMLRHQGEENRIVFTPEPK